MSVGSTGAASFAAGTSITLSVTNGRDAIWSGACSSGGDKERTCTFTLSGNASVTATCNDRDTKPASRSTFMRSLFVVAALGALTLPLPACGGGSSNDPPSTPTSPGSGSPGGLHHHDCGPGRQSVGFAKPGASRRPDGRVQEHPRPRRCDVVVSSSTDQGVQYPPRRGGTHFGLVATLANGCRGAGTQATVPSSKGVSVS